MIYLNKLKKQPIFLLTPALQTFLFTPRIHLLKLIFTFSKGIESANLHIFILLFVTPHISDSYVPIGIINFLNRSLAIFGDK